MQRALFLLGLIRFRYPIRMKLMIHYLSGVNNVQNHNIYTEIVHVPPPKSGKITELLV